MPQLVTCILDPGKDYLYGEISPIRILAEAGICFYLPRRSSETFVQCVYGLVGTLSKMPQPLSILCC